MYESLYQTILRAGSRVHVRRASEANVHDATESGKRARRNHCLRASGLQSTTAETRNPVLLVAARAAAQARAVARVVTKAAAAAAASALAGAYPTPGAFAVASPGAYQGRCARL